MFERLFQTPSSVARQRNGQLAEERCRFLVHCAGQQMSPGTLRRIATYTLIIAETLRLADRPGELIGRADIEAGADRYVKLANRGRLSKRPETHKGGCRWMNFMRYAVRWLKFLGRLHTPRQTHQPFSLVGRSAAVDFVEVGRDDFIQSPFTRRLFAVGGIHDAKDSELTGGIYRAIAPTKQVYRPGEWNTVRIELKREKLKATVNGVTIQDIDLSKYDQPVKRYDGTEALQLGTGP